MRGGANFSNKNCVGVSNFQGCLFSCDTGRFLPCAALSDNYFELYENIDIFGGFNDAKAMLN